MIELPTYPAKTANKDVHLKRNVLKEVEDHPSPMDPPEAYAKSMIQEEAQISEKPLLELISEHEEYLKILTAFDRALVEFKERGWKFTPEISAVLKKFFQWMDQDVPQHTRKEEKGLFPLLHEKLILSGEHSPGQKPVTPVDVMESDHRKVDLGVNLVFNLLGLAARIKDAESRNLLFEHAFHEGQEIVEVMKLHIYKENTTLFPLAQKLISPEEMKLIEQKISQLGDLL